MVDLKTTYMGIELRNPLVASPSPMMEHIDKLRALEDAGIGAVVMYSLFEEQIELEQHHLDLNLSHADESYQEALSYFPDLTHYHLGPERYLDHLHRVKSALRVPVFGSLNGVSPGGWVGYAQRMQEAGADGIELNIYHLPTDPTATPQDIEEMYLALVREVKSNVSIPLAVKLSPFFTAPANMARKLDTAGADALVIFNRFYQPDLDIEALCVTPSLELSTESELRLRLRWAAILYGNIRADIAITGGRYIRS
jgi:dihydroorotate dehydrogenase (fumarate)